MSLIVSINTSKRGSNIHFFVVIKSICLVQTQRHDQRDKYFEIVNTYLHRKTKGFTIEKAKKETFKLVKFLPKNQTKRKASKKSSNNEVFIHIQESMKKFPGQKWHFFETYKNGNWQWQILGKIQGCETGIEKNNKLHNGPPQYLFFSTENEDITLSSKPLVTSRKFISEGSWHPESENPAEYLEAET